MIAQNRPILELPATGPKDRPLVTFDAPPTVVEQSPILNIPVPKIGAIRPTVVFTESAQGGEVAPRRRLPLWTAGKIAANAVKPALLSNPASVEPKSKAGGSGSGLKDLFRDLDSGWTPDSESAGDDFDLPDFLK